MMRLNPPGPRFTALLAALVVVLAMAAPVAQLRAQEAPHRIAAASPAELIGIVKDNVLLSGDLVLRMQAQQRLVALGRQDPERIVPLLVAELAAPRGYGKKASHQRLALIEMLRDMAAAAEAAVPVLTEILNDPEERNDWVKFQAQGALVHIGTPAARAAAEPAAVAPGTRPSDLEADRAARQGAFLIRQELRRPSPGEASIEASLVNLKAAGPGAWAAVPTLLRAYNDARLGGGLRARIAAALTAMAVADVAAAAADHAAAAGTPDLLDEVIAETRSDDDFIAGLAMAELGRLGPSEAAMAALIEALAAGRSPGEAARMLGDFGAASAPALAHLVAYFEDPRAGANAIQAVAKIGVAEPSAVAALRRIVAQDGHPRRGPAATALGRLRVAEALPELTAALADRRKYTRILVAGALGQLAAAAAVPALAALLDDPDTDVRRAAVEALGRIGPPARMAAPRIARALESSDRRLKEVARRALADIGGEPAEASLIRDAARYAPADLAQARQRAAGGAAKVAALLRSLPPARGRQLARALAADPDPEAGFAGVAYLIRIGRQADAVPGLAALLVQGDRAEDVLGALARLSMHGGGGAGASDTLIIALRRHLADNWTGYTAAQQARLRKYLGLDPETDP